MQCKHTPLKNWSMLGLIKIMKKRLILGVIELLPLTWCIIPQEECWWWQETKEKGVISIYIRSIVDFITLLVHIPCVSISQQTSLWTPTLFCSHSWNNSDASITLFLIKLCWIFNQSPHPLYNLNSVVSWSWYDGLYMKMSPWLHLGMFLTDDNE